MSIIGFLILILGVVLVCQRKEDKEDGNFKKIMLGIIYFIVLFFVYAFIIVIISSVILYFVGGAESGLWAVSLLLCYFLAPVLSINKTLKIVNKNKKQVIIKEKINIPKNTKLHKIDLIFIIGIAIIGILGGIVDGFYWKDATTGGFPVFIIMSIYGAYALWIILLIYSMNAYNCEENKPRYVQWYMFFVLPFFHIIFGMIGLALASFIINIFHL